MFSPQSPSRTNIEEANKHLQMLHSRIAELEQATETQAEVILTLQNKEAETAQMLNMKDNENAEIRQRLEVSHEKIGELIHQSEQKDKIFELKLKLSFITHCSEQLDAASNRHLS